MSVPDSKPSERLRQRMLSRREFLDAGARNAAGVAAIGAGVVGLAEQRASAAAEPKQPVSVGVIGIRNQGKLLARSFAGIDGVRVTHICDVDQHLFAPVVKLLEAEQGSAPELLSDYRAMLDEPTVDVVVIAAPDHWHSHMAVDAIAAGKHLYLETPVTHTLEESRRLLGLSRNANTLIQTGLSHRSAAHFQSAIELVRSGSIGQVRMAKAWSTHSRRSIGIATETAAPDGVDYHAWLGPAAPQPFHPNRFHYHWRWNWNFGSGELGNWGVPLLDTAQWGLGVDQPVRVTSVGGKHYFDDDQETPDTQQVIYDFGDSLITWEHRQWSQYANEGRSAGVAFYGNAGTLILDRGGWKVYGAKDGPSQSKLRPSSESGQDSTAAHCRNLIDALRGTAPLTADLAVGVRASALCHLGNLSHRAGCELTSANASAAAAEWLRHG